MLIGIISDIHGNLEAFQAVIDHMEKNKAERAICLGDLIGYGPNPDEVVTLCREKGYSCIMGNHEAALVQKKMHNWLNFQAKENSIETEKLLSGDNFRYCSELPTSLKHDNNLFVHGMIPDSVLAYMTMLSDNDLVDIFQENEFDTCFVGHTHELMMACWDGKSLVKQHLKNTTYHLKRERRYIVNVGSVGQPRDGNNKAKYLLWNSTDQTIEVCYVPYNYRQTIKKIKERGFPEAYGLRLL